MNTRSLKNLKKALLDVTDNVGRYQALDSTRSYIVWQEDSESASAYSNNKKDIQVIQGTIDLYARRKEKDVMVEQIQHNLNEAGIIITLNSVQKENDFIHYEWIFEVS